jgi:Fe-coproporphyrin III synthase
MPFGSERSRVVDNLISFLKKYPDFVINGEKQLSLMKGNWEA